MCVIANADLDINRGDLQMGRICTFLLHERNKSIKQYVCKAGGGGESMLKGHSLNTSNFLHE